MRPTEGLREAAPTWMGPSPTLSNQPPPQELELMLHIARKFDVAGRDERNRALGRAGEEPVLAHEHATLKAAGRDSLTHRSTSSASTRSGTSSTAGRMAAARTTTPP